jgi:lipopolysaccharide/colanic/teichoic acid biosynthesis glycosyltransferase
MSAAPDAGCLIEGRGLGVKRVFDVVFALTALMALAPVMAVIALAIKRSSEGPSLFRQERHGLHGKPFTLLKFRTMHSDAAAMLDQVQELNEANGPAFSIKGDPRIIPGIGAFLRRSNLDELPQLINVLRGNMSIVGPRPHETFVVEQYLPWHRDRLLLKPGLTCTWQIEPNRHQVPFDDWMRMDVDYVATRTLLGDCRIIAKTVLMLARPGSGTLQRPE